MLAFPALTIVQMRENHVYSLILVASFAMIFAASAGAQSETASAKATFRADVVVKGLTNPWALAFLPEGRLLVTERPGKMSVYGADGKLVGAVAGVPEVAAVGQGGLLDVVLAPDFDKSKRIYFAYAEPRADRKNGTAVASATLADERTKPRLTDVKVIFRQEPAYGGGFHFGSRIAIARDGNLFVTLGERNQKTPAQDLNEHLGKVVRIAADGSVPKDNPFVGKSGARPEIWSYGHRNPQSAAIHPASGKLWIVEHGARGGDEINIPEAGRNYGWPVITYGRDYSGIRIGEGTAKPGMEQPIHYWDPSIAPSGMAFYTGDAFPGWKGSLFVGALAGQHLNRLELSGDKVAREERLLENMRERIRDVRQAPDGTLWLVTDSRDGKIIKLSPAK
jgi:glucose/arabinose dehydrogenase